ncbi:MAG: hypothetical protein WBI53_14090 [Paludibacter sp.]
MNILEKIKFYSHPYRFLEILSLNIVNTIKIWDLQNKLSCSDLSGICSVKYFTNDVIVSLTSYSKRIHTVYLTIESILNQTVKPNKIILWLDEEEFNDTTIPFSLKKQVARGLTINYCKNIKSYKKLIPTLKYYPNDIIITIDDDLIYPLDFLDKFLSEYSKNPFQIYFSRGHRILKNKNSFALYNNWPLIKDYNADLLNIPTGVGGVLYFPGCFCEDVLREDLFMTMAPNADDLWFKAMSMLKGVKAKCVKWDDWDKEFYILQEVQDIRLGLENCDAGQNDVQWSSIVKYYKDKLTL